MALVSANRVLETSTTSGTGTLTLAGAVAGYQSFSSAIGNGNTCYYTIVDTTASVWETGIGTYTSAGNTLARTTVLSNSSGTASAISLAGNSINVFVTLPAEKVVTTDTLASPPAIGGTTPAAISATTLSLTGTTNQVSSVAVTSDPAAPSAGNLKTFAKTIAGGYTAPAFLNATNAVAQLQPAFANKRIGTAIAVANATAYTLSGLVSLTNLGNTTAGVTTTSMFTRAVRVNYTSSATAGSLTYFTQSTAAFTLGSATTPAYGGFYYVHRFGIADTVASPRTFVGITSSVSAPTNVEPSTLTNCIGVGQGASNTNLFVYYGGSAAQTPIDLGASFPTNTSSTDWYELTLFAPPTSNNTVYYQVVRLNTGNVASGTLTGTAGTVLPSNTTLLSLRAWRTNNATAAAVTLGLGNIYIETDY